MTDQGEHEEVVPWTLLTKTERVVARLVAEGLTNPQIAEKLYVSRYTVQTHLKRVFRKTGVKSRAQLAANVARWEPSGHGGNALT